MILNVVLGLGTAITLATLNVRQHIKNLQNQVVYIELLGQSGGIWNWNRQTDEVQYAPKFREMLGFAGNDTDSFPENIKASRDRIHADDMAVFEERLANQQQTRKPFSVEFRMLDMPTRCLIATEPRSEQQEPSSTLKTARNMNTSSKKAIRNSNASLSRLRTTFKNPCERSQDSVNFSNNGTPTRSTKKDKAT